MFRPTDLWPQATIDCLAKLGAMDPPWAHVLVKEDMPEFGEPNSNLTVNVLKSLADGPMGEWLQRGGGPNIISKLAVGRWLAHGPKVCVPGKELCEAMSHVEVRLGLEELSLPFPEVLVVLPPGAYEADYCLVAAFEKGLLCEVMSKGHKGLEASQFIVHRPRPWVIEDTLNLTGQVTTEGTVVYTGRPLAAVATRVAINCCLMLSGQTRFAFPLDHERDARLARERTPRGERARHRLALELLVAEFDQTVQFRREEREAAGPGEPTGRHMPPHWRKGHWRSQPCGEGRLQRRRVLIAPVMVRKDLFAGQQSDTSATYQL